MNKALTVLALAAALPIRGALWLADVVSPRCPLCLERTRHMDAHMHVEHAGGL